MCWGSDLVATEVHGTEGARDIARGESGTCFALADGSVVCRAENDVVPVRRLANVRAIDVWGYVRRSKDSARACGWG